MSKFYLLGLKLLLQQSSLHLERLTSQLHSDLRTWISKSFELHYTDLSSPRTLILQIFGINEPSNITLFTDPCALRATLSLLASCTNMMTM